MPFLRVPGARGLLRGERLPMDDGTRLCAARRTLVESGLHTLGDYEPPAPRISNRGTRVASLRIMGARHRRLSLLLAAGLTVGAIKAQAGPLEHPGYDDEHPAAAIDDAKGLRGRLAIWTEPLPATVFGLIDGFNLPLGVNIPISPTQDLSSLARSPVLTGMVAEPNPRADGSRDGRRANPSSHARSLDLDVERRMGHRSRVSVERVVRTVPLEKNDALDREDIARTTAEERLSAVERLRQEWFGDFAPERRLERVLACTDLRGNPVPLDRGPRNRSARRAAIHRRPRRVRGADEKKRPASTKSAR